MTVALALLGIEAVLTALDGGRLAVDPAGHQTNVVIFTSTVCPVAADYYPRLAHLWEEFGRRPGVSFLVVFSNKTESLEDIRRHAAEMRFPFPVYRDDDNVLADALGARVTPEAVVFGLAGSISYLGAIDDATNPARVKRRYLRDAIRASLAGHRPPPPLKLASPVPPPYG